MAVDIGPKIKLTGESEFQKQLKQVNTQVKTLGTEMKAVESAFIGQEKSIEALTAKSKVLNEQIDKQREKYNLLSKRLEEASKLYGENDERTQKLQQELNKTTTELNKLEHELETTTKELNGEADSADKAGKETREAGEDAKESSKGWETLGKTVAAVGTAMVAAAAAAAAAIAEAGKALVSFTVDAAGYADDILTMSSVTGMSTEKLQELQYAADLVDVSVDTITGSMKKNLSAMRKAQTGNKDMAAAYKQLGVSVMDANGRLRDDETVYWELINALGQVEDETKRDVLAMQVLGKSAQELNPLIEAGADNMQALAVQAHNAGYVLSEDALEAFHEFDDQLQKLDVGATAAKNALGTILLPVLTDLAGEGVDLLGQFTNGVLDANGDLSQMSDVVGEVLPQVLDLILEYVPELIELAGTMVTSLAKALTKGDNLKKIMEAASTLFTELLQSILGLLPELLPVAVETILTLAKDLLAPQNIKMIINSGIQLILTLINGLSDALPELIPLAVEAVLTLVEALTDPDNLIKLIEAAPQLIMAVAEGLIRALPKLLEKAPVIIENLVESIIKAAPALLQAGLELILTLIKGIVDGFGSLVQTGKDIVDSVKDGFQAKVESAKTWGKDMISNFVSGITSKWEDLKSSVSGVAQTIKNLIGFSEPKYGPLSDFSSYAPDMVDLFIKGLQQGQARLQRQLEETFDPASMTAGVADVTVGGAGGMAVTIPLNIDGQKLTQVIAQIQWAQGTAAVRNYGTALA